MCNSWPSILQILNLNDKLVESLKLCNRHAERSFNKSAVLCFRFQFNAIFSNLKQVNFGNDFHV